MRRYTNTQVCNSGALGQGKSDSRGQDEWRKGLLITVPGQQRGKASDKPRVRSGLGQLPAMLPSCVRSMSPSFLICTANNTCFRASLGRFHETNPLDLPWWPPRGGNSGSIIHSLPSALSVLRTMWVSTHEKALVYFIQPFRSTHRELSPGTAARPEE